MMDRKAGVVKSAAPRWDGSTDIKEPGSLNDRWCRMIEVDRSPEGNCVRRDLIAKEDDGVPLAPESGPPPQARVPAGVEGGGLPPVNWSR